MTISKSDRHRLAELADGLEIAIRFHDREVDLPLLAAVQEHGMTTCYDTILQSMEGRAAARDWRAALLALGVTPDPAVLDDLAADFADIYLTHGYRVAPNGSVWLTEDKLERQLPMFEVRDWYAHYDISVPNWRLRADDHLVHELQFTLFLLRLGGDVAATDAGRFLDLHVLPWLPEFCRRAHDRVNQLFYAALMAVTLSVLEEIRTVLERITGQYRAVRQIADLDTQRRPEPEVQPYVPGLAESW